MEEAVQTAQVDERAIIRQVFHRALNDLPFLEILQGLLPRMLSFLFQKDPSGEDDVVSFSVEFDDFELQPASDQVIQISDGLEIDLRTRQKSHHAPDIDGEATLDLGTISPSITSPSR